MSLSPRTHHNEEEHRRFLADTANLALQGKVLSNNEVTLTANTTTTTKKDFNVGKDSVICFMPTTANAAEAKKTMYVSNIDPRNNQFTITHTNDANTDKTFKYVVLGATRNDLSS